MNAYDLGAKVLLSTTTPKHATICDLLQPMFVGLVDCFFLFVPRDRLAPGALPTGTAARPVVIRSIEVFGRTRGSWVVPASSIEGRRNDRSA